MTKDSTLGAAEPTKITPKKKEVPELFCSFCGKRQNEVRKLIAGSNAWICNECIELSVEIITEGEQVSTTLPLPYSQLLGVSIPYRIMHDTKFDFMKILPSADSDEATPKHVADLVEQIGDTLVKMRKEDILQIVDRDIARVEKVFEGSQKKLSEMRTSDLNLSAQDLNLMLESQGKSKQALTPEEKERLGVLSEDTKEASKLEELRDRADKRLSNLRGYRHFVEKL